jgi:hypothetical protein
VALVYSPQTGSYVDPATGQVFHDPQGTIPSTDPGLTSQAQRSLGISNQLFQQLGQYGAQFQQAQNGQNQLGAYLTRVINGSAPSAAGTQLQTGLDTIKSGVNSNVASATGPNQGLAVYGGQQAYADAAAKANAAAAGERVNEVNSAVANKGQLLGQQAGANAQMYATNVAGGNAASGIAGSAGATQADIDEKNRQAWLNFAGNLVNAGGAALTANGAKAAPAAAAA